MVPFYSRSEHLFMYAKPAGCPTFLQLHLTMSHGRMLTRLPAAFMMHYGSLQVHCMLEGIAKVVLAAGRSA